MIENCCMPCSVVSKGKENIAKPKFPVVFDCPVSRTVVGLTPLIFPFLQ